MEKRNKTERWEERKRRGGNICERLVNRIKKGGMWRGEKKEIANNTEMIRKGNEQERREEMRQREQRGVN